MSKTILFNADARKAIQKGITIAARAVKATLGPRGRNVILDRGFGSPHMTNDGVSIAKEITLKDKFENMGAELVKDVANKTNDLAGDGTTSTVVLFEALVEEGMKHTEMGLSAMDIRAGMEKAGAAAVAALKGLAKPVAGDAVKQVATISAESEEIGETIAKVIGIVGKRGVVTVEESQTFGIEDEVLEGLQFERGYISHYLVTNPERMEAEYKDVAILITDKKIAAAQEIVPLLENVAGAGKKELVIIADEIEGEALGMLVLNKLRGVFQVLCIKAPGFGDRKKDFLEDIAIVTGGTVISEAAGMKLSEVSIDSLGRAGRVISTKDTTTIVGGKGKKADIATRITALQQQAAQTEAKYEKEKLEERAAKLSGGVAVIRVGAASETEMRYLKDKIEDAVNATKAAVEEGVVPGGGTALVKAAQKAEGSAAWDTMSKEEELGYRIVLAALRRPLQQIAINSGKGGEVIIAEVEKAKGFAGYNAVSGVIEKDMLKAGILDPLKVARGSIEHSVSAAAIFLTTEVAIADEPEEKKEPVHPGMM